MTAARRPGGRSARVRTAVLDAVLAELAEHGYDALTVDGVAERSGVHRTSIYRRWSDVGGLLADALVAAAADDWAPPDTGTLAGDLAALNREVHRYLRDPASVARAVIAASFRSEAAARAMRTFWADRYERCASLVARAIERGELDAGVDARRLLIAATAPVYHHLVLLGDRLGGAEAAAYATDVAEAASRTGRGRRAPRRSPAG